MNITKRECMDFGKSVCHLAEKGKVTETKCGELMTWASHVLEHLSETETVSLPVEFASLFREFRKSYTQDSEAVLLEAEERALPTSDYVPSNVSYDRSIMRQNILKSLESLETHTELTGSPVRWRRSEREVVGGAFEQRMRQKAGASEVLRSIMDDPFQAAFWSGLGKALGGAGRGMTVDEQDAINRGLVDDMGKGISYKSLTAGVSPGSTWLSEDVSKAVFDICPLYGAYTTLRVIQLAQGKTKFVKVTALPTAAWLIPSALQGTAIPVDTTLAGSSVSLVCNTLAVNIEISLELLADESVDWGTALLEKIARAVAYGLDWACFAADGSADIVNGSQTGIFKLAAAPVVNAAAGNTTISALEHSDFMRAVSAIAPAGLQRECRWWMHPSFLPELLKIKDGNIFLCQTPGQNPSGEYTLCGFPLTLTAVAPSVGTAGQPVAAFGWGEAYTIGMVKDMEVMTGVPKWNQAMKNIRALTRARCEVGDASMFSVLKLAAA